MRGIDRFLDLTDVRPLLAPFYSSHGRPSVDPELMIRMLLLGYCMGPDLSGSFAKRCMSIWPIGPRLPLASLVNAAVRLYQTSRSCIAQHLSV